MLVARTTGCRPGRSPAVPDVDVVAVERDVERADRKLDAVTLYAGQLGQQAGLALLRRQITQQLLPGALRPSRAAIGPRG